MRIPCLRAEMPHFGMQACDFKKNIDTSIAKIGFANNIQKNITPLITNLFNSDQIFC